MTNNFKYLAKDKDGKSVTGTLEASSDTEAADVLHKKNLIIVSIEQIRQRRANSVSGSGKVKSDDLVVFSRQLATMINSGISLVQSLGILGEQIESKVLHGVIISVRKDIEAGMNFCDSLSKYPRVFSEFFVNMVRAGEASGMLDEVLDRLATYLEKSTALARKVKSSMVYPAVVISMAILITTFLLLKVVPTFKGIFDMLGGQLPVPTQILIGVSEMLRKNFLFMVIALVIIIVAFKKYVSTDKGRHRYDAIMLKLPIIGDLVRKVAISKFSRTFSTLVRSGVNILNALDIVAKTSGNKIVEDAVASCRTAVRNGEPISKPLLKSPIFPPMVCRMIGVGEQTGQLEKMLTKIADFYEEQVDAAVAGLTSIIEPLVIAFLGIVIGGIVVSLFLPIFKITELLAR